MSVQLPHALHAFGQLLPRLGPYTSFTSPRIGWLGLGSNHGDRAWYLRRAVELLNEVPGVRLAQVSQVYLSEPLGTTGRSFFNLVVEIEVECSPMALLDACQRIELQLGRVRTGHWQKRTIDIDLLAIQGVEINTSRLILPHPHAASRLFVLVPWLELANPRLVCGHSVHTHYEQTVKHDPEQQAGLQVLGPLEEVQDPVNSPWEPFFGIALSSDPIA